MITNIAVGTTPIIHTQWFEDCLQLAEALQEKVGVLLVVNVQGKTKPVDDYAGDSVSTEFLKSAELNDLVQAFDNAGLYCEVLNDENGFLRWLTERRSSFPRTYPLVYNLAQNGTGPARSSMIPGLCRLHHIPLVDSDAYGVTITRHKFHTGAILRQCGLPAARAWWFTDRGWLPEAPPEGLRVIAKPTYESASIGVHEDSVFEMCRDANERLAEKQATYRQALTVQEFISGFEVEVPVFEADGPRTIMAVGIEVDGKRNLADRFLMYDEVAGDHYRFYDFADHNPSAAAEVKRIAREAFRTIGLAGVGRVDFRIRQDGSPVIIEMACKPHLTLHSSFCFAAQHIGASQADIMKFLVGSASRRHKFNV